MGGERTGQSRQALVGGDTVSVATQEAFGLVTLGGCSGCLLRPDWVVTAAHCIDPANPGATTVSAAWGGGLNAGVSRIHTFPGYDIALLQLASPIPCSSLPPGASRVINDDQFPYFGSEGGMYLTMFGRGIHQFASGEGATAIPSASDGQYRIGFAKVTRTEDAVYWYSSGSGDYIAGGDSGGPSFAWALNGYILVGVHATSHALYAPGHDGTPDPWMWVTATPEAGDAPLRAVREQIEAIMGPAAMPAVPAAGFIGEFSSDRPGPDAEAIATFQYRAQVGAERGFATAFPNFHEARYGRDHVGGTVFVRPEGVEWRNIPRAELDLPNLNDFGQQMRAIATHAGANGFPGGLPAFQEADFGDGLRIGAFLLKPSVAEWRDVTLYDLNLHEEDLGDIGKRFRATADYASRNGFVGGFPNMFHAEKEIFDPFRGGRRVETVCGTVLLRAPLAEWADVLLFRDPA